MNSVLIIQYIQYFQINLKRHILKLKKLCQAYIKPVVGRVTCRVLFAEYWNIFISIRNKVAADNRGIWCPGTVPIFSANRPIIKKSIIKDRADHISSIKVEILFGNYYSG